MARRAGSPRLIFLPVEEMWRRQGEREALIALEPGVCLGIPLGTHVHFRESRIGPVSAISVSMPPWPGGGKAVPLAGRWPKP